MPPHRFFFCQNGATWASPKYVISDLKINNCKKNKPFWHNLSKINVDDHVSSKWNKKHHSEGGSGGLAP